MRKVKYSIILLVVVLMFTSNTSMLLKPQAQGEIRNVSVNLSIEQNYRNALKELNRYDEFIDMSSIKLSESRASYTKIFEDNTVLVVSEEGFAFSKKIGDFLHVTSQENGEKLRFFR
ncbi:MAG: hypothetical protein ACLKAK_04565 [Alkaliphilus sp.]